jgi:hypothetical protein
MSTPEPTKRRPFAETYYERWMSLMPLVMDKAARLYPREIKGMQAGLDKIDSSDLAGQVRKILAWVFMMDQLVPGIAEQCGFAGGAGDMKIHPYQLDGFMMLWVTSATDGFAKHLLPGPTYKIAEHFGQNLHEKCKADFKISVLKSCAKPINMIIQFPESVTLHNKKGTEIHNCLMAINPEDGAGISFVFPPAHKKITKDSDLTNFRDDADYYYFTWAAVEDHSLTFAEVFEQHATGLLTSDVTKDLILYAVKCAMYIFSSNPDLTDYKPRPTSHEVPRKERDRNRTENAKSHGSFPLSLVGYSWQKPRSYSVGEIVVTGHWRWQPCGPALAFVKLIWIDDHVRNYNKDQTAPE